MKLKPRKESPRLFDVETIFAHGAPQPSPPAQRDGPAQVASEAYRDHWDGIFGGAHRRKRRELLN